jgi:hypothetical protein
MRFLKIILLLLVFSKNTIAQITGPEQDCVGAIKICNGVTLDVQVTYSGDGVIKDLLFNSNVCLSNRENNSVWFYFEIDSPGTVEFIINPAAGDDYDFAVFLLDSNKTCSYISDSNLAPVRCSYSAFAGTIGLSSNPDSNFLPALQVQQGEKYYLIIDNFNIGGSGFTIDFSGTTAQFVSASICTTIISNTNDNNSLNYKVNIYPNPTNNHLNITTTLKGNQGIQYQIINPLGASIAEGKSNQSVFSVDVSALHRGIYFIRLQSGNAQTVKRFVRE